MSCVDNTIKIGDMVIRAYAFDIEEFGLVVDTKPWRETVLIPEGESEEDEDVDMSDIEVFTVLWPSGFMTAEMDVELYSFEYYFKVVIDQLHAIAEAS